MSDWISRLWAAISGQRNEYHAMTSSQHTWIGAGFSHQGEVRDSNQDALAIDNDQRLWVVADGMGGYAGGQVASALAVSAIQEHIRALSTTNNHTLPQPTTILTEAVAAAKTAIQSGSRPSQIFAVWAPQWLPPGFDHILSHPWSWPMWETAAPT